LVELFQKHFPSGAVNIIFGSGRTTSTPILESGKVKGLAFIGQSKAAAELKKYHPKPHQFSTLLGLEAKNPAIVLEGTDIDSILPEIISGAFSFNGQRCTALKIMFVHRSVLNEFLNKISAAADNLTIGFPWDDKVQITALPEDGKVAYLQSIIEDAVENGAKIINTKGGKSDGRIFYPTILSPVNESMRIYHEEQFGPVVPVVIFDEVQEVIDFLVHSHYGQQASIFGSNPEEIGNLINQIGNLVGRININSQCQRGPDYLPFTGRKDSAQGTVSLGDALEAFSLRVILAGKNTETNTDLINNIAPYTSILEACSSIPASEF
jgi:glyceraldehyde-3-phosphate dehydrogenase (NADP+)